MPVSSRSSRSQARLPQVHPRCVGGRGGTWSRFVFFSFSLFLLSGLVLRRFGLVDLQRVEGSLPVRLARLGVVLALFSLTVDVW